jgi:hypothetical protein
MRSVALAAGIAASSALGASAQNVSLIHKTPVGQVLAVEEGSLLEIEADVRHPDWLGGKTRSKWRQVEQKARTFTQKIVEAPDAGTRTLELAFDLATKETMRPNGTDRIKTFTSLHRKRLHVGFVNDGIVKVEPAPAMVGDVLAPPAPPGAAQKPAGAAGGVTNEDKGDIGFAEKLYSTLPKGEVKPGEVWTVDPDAAGRAVFGALYNPAVHKVEGKCQYKGTGTIDGRKCARILIQLKGGGDLGGLQGALQVEMAPQGTLIFDLDEGFIRAYDLAGPVKVNAAQAVAAIEIAGTGRAALRYKAILKERGVKADPAAKPAEGAQSETPRKSP